MSVKNEPKMGVATVSTITNRAVVQLYTPGLHMVYVSLAYGRFRLVTVRSAVSRSRILNMADCPVRVRHLCYG
ncbi:unnamed protein product [Cylicostephanus goldi]|uniref:Uncharacterized protein n=1 Tax=Cylicostephanus goldi TaxID=71465 RepID=A0A3P6RRE6_CYLGO|nr:unnamed protein product [Cylicostephanus goldi]